MNSPALISLLLAFGSWWGARQVWPWQVNNWALFRIQVYSPLVYFLLHFSYEFLLFSTSWIVLYRVVVLVWRRQGKPEPTLVVRPKAEGLSVVLGRNCAGMVQVGEKELALNTAILGVPGTGKSTLLLQILRQLTGHHAGREDRLSGLVLEVKGDISDAAARILRECHREQDLILVDLKTGWRYNPLNNDMDDYALASYVTSLMKAVFGAATSDSFWHTGPTSALSSIILAFRLADGYLTFRDIYHGIVSLDLLKEKIAKIETKLEGRRLLLLRPEDYAKLRHKKKAKGQKAERSEEYEEDDIKAQFIFNAEGPWWQTDFTEQMHLELEARRKSTGIAPEPFLDAPEGEPDPVMKQQLESLKFWFDNAWMGMEPRTRANVASSVEVFLKIFDQNVFLRETFCPPLEAYTDPTAGVHNGLSRPVIESFDKLIESGQVCCMAFPSTLNSAVARVIGVLTKVNYQNAVLSRPLTPNMRPCFAIYDEWKHWVSHGGLDFGDEKFMSLNRAYKCFLVVADHSVNSLHSMIGDGWKTLLGLCQVKGFLRVADPETAKYGQDICSDQLEWVKNFNLSESSQDAHVMVGGPSLSDRKGVSVSESIHQERRPRFPADEFMQLEDYTAIVRVHKEQAVRCHLEPI